MLKMLIANAFDAFSKGLANEFSRDFQVKCSYDGVSALQDLSNFQPDILLINFFLPNKDGLAVLKASPFIPKIVVGMTPYLNDYTIYMAVAQQVKYIICIPTDIKSVRDQLTGLLNAANDPQFQTLLLLRKLNMHTHLDGYRQLCLAIPMFAENPGTRLSKELYPAIADKMALADPRAVEHSIRKSIADGWLRRDPTVWDRYFSPRSNPPTNKEFIARLAEQIKPMSG